MICPKCQTPLQPYRVRNHPSLKRDGTFISQTSLTPNEKDIVICFKCNAVLEVWEEKLRMGMKRFLRLKDYTLVYFSRRAE